ncbi:MAG TPA: hypothetical protein PKA63_08245 [Oligoflexia bacterium]|nr:hypothetical protein [Oligoflexia bacterium]HMP48641.1 hypothetical protein [Oligoflexia bacterium]
MTSDIATIFLKLPTSSIVFLKFLLESYEGIAELRTLKIGVKESNKASKKGQKTEAPESIPEIPDGIAIVVVMATPDTLFVVRRMLLSEQKQLEWEEIKKPVDLSGDWLLKSTVE